uniref:Flavodoxin-like domain-containing protein n=1 Tax=Florenciella parvula TaxID=236787 RepID=A0A7S2CHP9_9STRA|mmetsp:Transcript_29141/g.59683  ORF Transcript_29141/g.59683 Transcript_29141/m.59683 type:complete len:168 (+) Transcript_29141:72-575(+)
MDFLQSAPVPVLVAALAVLVLVAIAIRPKPSPASRSETTRLSGKSTAEGTDAGTLTYPAGKLVIFFGSQTGTAEGFAQQLAGEAKKHGFDAQAADLEDFEESEMTETSRALFMMATYGEGEPTDNAASFMKWVQNGEGELSASTLSGMQFAVFGLGNTQYEVHGCYF